MSVSLQRKVTNELLNQLYSSFISAYGHVDGESPVRRAAGYYEVI